MLIIFIGLLILIFSIAFYIAGYKKGKSINQFTIINAERDRLTKYWKGIIEDLSKENMQKDTELKELRRKYNHLFNEIKRKEQAKKAIQNPKNIDEIIKRFEALGYEVRKREVQ
jgi:tRNA-dihydrouridine synthase